MRNLGYWLKTGLTLVALAGCTHVADYGYHTPASYSTGFHQTPLDTLPLDTLRSEAAVSKSPDGFPTSPLRPRH